MDFWLELSLSIVLLLLLLPVFVWKAAHRTQDEATRASVGAPTTVRSVIRRRRRMHGETDGLRLLLPACLLLLAAACLLLLPACCMLLPMCCLHGPGGAPVVQPDAVRGRGAGCEWRQHLG